MWIKQQPECSMRPCVQQSVYSGLVPSFSATISCLDLQIPPLYCELDWKDFTAEVWHLLAWLLMSLNTFNIRRTHSNLRLALVCCYSQCKSLIRTEWWSAASDIQGQSASPREPGKTKKYSRKFTDIMHFNAKLWWISHWKVKELDHIFHHKVHLVAIQQQELFSRSRLNFELHLLRSDR